MILHPNRHLAKAAACTLFTTCLCLSAKGQSAVMTPETLWKLGRVSALGVTDDHKTLLYKVTTPDVEGNTFTSASFALNLGTGAVRPYDAKDNLLRDANLSPDGRWRIEERQVKLMPVYGTDFYPDLAKSNAMVYNSLQHRHWDSWEDGLYNHLFLVPVGGGIPAKDLLEGEPYDCPTQPFGGSDDYTWSPDSKHVVYVAKKLQGTPYMLSTNTDLYQYDLATGTTTNLTADNPGYDTHPLYSAQGTLAWLSMARDGYESDKNDLKVRINNQTLNLTVAWDGTVEEFVWSADGRTLYFVAPTKGTKQLFSVALPARDGKLQPVRQITNGTWDVTGLVKHVGNTVISGRTDMNRAKELYAISLGNGSMRQLTRVNDELYSTIKTGKVEARWLKTHDDLDLLTWVIYPPDFDPAKKYPALLYAQGGPQSALSQFYSFRWNFQVMAAQGYIVVAPNRRGMPGHGTAWNEQISRDWGGNNMQDYLTAIDALAREPYVDENRLACVGASYGGFSVFYLAGIHEGRFKSFISHCGIFNLKSMYGTTEELFFANWDMGGPYWEKDNAAAQRTYTEFNPIKRVGQWTAPILIIQGGKDYRVPESQAFEAFTAAQVRGIKSRLLHFPDENHWVLKPQNALVWQREFFKWLGETVH